MVVALVALLTQANRAEFSGMATNRSARDTAPRRFDSYQPLQCLMCQRRSDGKQSAYLLSMSEKKLTSVNEKLLRKVASYHENGVCAQHLFRRGDRANASSRPERGPEFTPFGSWCQRLGQKALPTTSHAVLARQ